MGYLPIAEPAIWIIGAEMTPILVFWDISRAQSWGPKKNLFASCWVPDKTRLERAPILNFITHQCTDKTRERDSRLPFVVFFIRCRSLPMFQPSKEILVARSLLLAGLMLSESCIVCGRTVFFIGRNYTDLSPPTVQQLTLEVARMRETAGRRGSAAVTNGRACITIAAGPVRPVALQNMIAQTVTGPTGRNG
jgi:hypothetical protein